MTDEKLPLPWRQKRTPTRNQKRSRRWRKVFPGLHFEDTTWVVIEGPWRRVKKAGSQSMVTVRCSSEYGGCDKEYERKLYTIVQGTSTICVHCRRARRRAKVGNG